MATSNEFINYVCEQLSGVGEIRYRKMFGEYMIYINEKPILIVCENTVYVKKEEIIQSMMKNAKTGFPYKGAKEHYILDIEEAVFCKKIVMELEKVTPIKCKKIRNENQY